MSLEFVEIQAQVNLLAQELQAEFEEARRHRRAQPVDFAIQADNDPAPADVAAEAALSYNAQQFTLPEM